MPLFLSGLQWNIWLGSGVWCWKVGRVYPGLVPELETDLHMTSQHLAAHVSACDASRHPDAVPVTNRTQTCFSEPVVSIHVCDLLHFSVVARSLGVSCTNPDFSSALTFAASFMQTAVPPNADAD